MPTLAYRIPGVLNSKELLVAEAIQARAWETLVTSSTIPSDDEREAKSRLGGIVLRLMSERSDSISDLAVAAVRSFHEKRGLQGQ